MKKRNAISASIILFLAAIFLFSATNALAEKMDIPLYKLHPAKTADLRCIKGIYGINIPIPDRWEITKASLTIHYVNSANILADKSQLAIRLNETPVGQTKLNPLVTDGIMNVSIPARLLIPGYNTMNLEAVQHYTKDCEHPCAPDLWTSIKMEDSILHVEYNLKPVPLKLSQLAPFVYDPKIFTDGHVNIITEDLSSPLITAAGIAASGVARKFNYRKVTFTTSTDIRQGVDNIIIGKKGFIDKFLAAKGMGITGITGPFVKTMHLPLPLIKKPESDATHSLLVISGVENAHLKLAAETLAFINFPYPGTDQMIATDFKMNDISMYSGLLMIKADKIYRLKALGYATHSFEGMQPGNREINFRLPADFLIKENQQAELKLNFSYGAGMRGDSNFNVMLNDTRVGAISLSKQGGDTIEGYKITIPTFLLKQGANTIRFAPYLTPQAKECDLIQPESLFLTLFDNSTFYLPPMPHYVEMPQLTLFMMNGFPFTNWPDGFDSVIYLASANASTVNAALNVIGLITQKNSYPLLSFEIRVGPNEKVEGDTRNILVIGEVDGIPEDIRKSAPIKLIEKSEMQYPVPESLGGKTTFVMSKQYSGLGSGAGAIMEFQSPYKRGRTILMLAATTGADLLKLSEALLTPGVQSQTKGDVVIVEYGDPDPKVSSMETGNAYFTGKHSGASFIRYYLFSHPKIYYALIILILLLICGAVYYILSRTRRHRISEGTSSMQNDAAPATAPLPGAQAPKAPSGAAVGKGPLGRALSMLARIFLKDRGK